MVEATAAQGPLTKALNELVLRINGLELVTEGVSKFSCLVLGLLNVRSLDAWLGYVRTRESVLCRHYERGALLRAQAAGEPGARALLVTLVDTLRPLALLPFRVDLLFECRQLHLSLRRMDSCWYQQPNTSPVHQHQHLKVSMSPLPMLVMSCLYMPHHFPTLLRQRNVKRSTATLSHQTLCFKWGKYSPFKTKYKP